MSVLLVVAVLGLRLAIEGSPHGRRRYRWDSHPRRRL